MSMQAAVKKRPNILLITCDQLRQDFVHTYGCDFMSTPNIDRLAAEGCRFENAYSPNPVCIPARHNILTGLTARHHGYDDNYFGNAAKPCPYYLPTFPQILSDSGYETIAIGKIHFQPERRATGFDYFENMDEVPQYREEDDYSVYLKEQGYGNLQSVHGVRHLLYMQPQRSMVPQEHHGSSWVADRAIRYFEQTKGRRPFLMWAGFIHPHPPLDVPDAWADLYKGKIPPHSKSITPLSTLAEENKHLAGLATEESINRMRELYAAAISFADYNIGRMLTKLREIGELDNTLILFTSDHGEMLGDLSTYQKFLPYDASCKIPMIIRYPQRLKAGTTASHFVDLNDILPTFVDAAGTTYPANYDLPGESLLVEHGVKNRTCQYIEHQRENKRWCSLRDKRYKYVYYYGDDDQLFDLENNPEETRNLLYQCTDSTVLEIRDRLKAQLIAYEARYGLCGGVKNGVFVGQTRYVEQPYRETCFPAFTRNLVDADEIAGLSSMDDEILTAIAKEPVVKLSELNIAPFLQQFGGYTSAQVQALLEKAKAQGNY